jgi:hypothetical protein
MKIHDFAIKKNKVVIVKFKTLHAFTVFTIMLYNIFSP